MDAWVGMCVSLCECVCGRVCLQQGCVGHWLSGAWRRRRRQLWCRRSRAKRGGGTLRCAVSTFGRLYTSREDRHAPRNASAPRPQASSSRPAPLLPSSPWPPPPTHPHIPQHPPRECWWRARGSQAGEGGVKLRGR